jgi:hypothetical protein
MVCHLEYFNEQGYFQSTEYAKNMGIDLYKKTVGKQELSDQDYLDLKEAIQLSDADSETGKLPGIVNLIQLVEKLQDKYGVAHDHKHPVDAIVKSMAAKEFLVSRYGLEKLVTTTTTHTQTIRKTRTA